MKLLQYFPYRKAYVRGGNPLYFPRELMKDLELELAKMAGVRKDNHTCYLVEVKSQPIPVQRCIMFTDFDCIIGDKFDIKSW